MRKQIGSVLALKRKEKGMSQIDIANALEKYDIHIKNAAVSSWEKNNNTPTEAQLLELCEILDIADIYTEFIGEHKNAPFAEYSTIIGAIWRNGNSLTEITGGVTHS